MWPFVVLLLVPILIQHIGANDENYQKKNRNALIFFFVGLTLLIMLRHESVGNDTSNYMLFFENFAKTEWSALTDASLEIGYSYFNKIVSLFSADPQIFLAIAAIVVSAMIYPTYKRLCKDPSLAIVLFCALSTFFMMFSGIRQMIAVGIGFAAYELTRRKKLIFFLLVVALATTFHSSAFMLAFMYPLYHAKITTKWLLVVVPVLIVVYFFNRPIFSLLTSLLTVYERIDSRISLTGAYAMLLLFAVFAVFAFLIPDESKLDQETVGLRNFLLMALTLQMFAPLHVLAMRMNYYYIIFIPLLLPKIIAARSERWEQVAIVGRHVMVMFFLAYFFVNAYTGEVLHVFPYHFFWENVV